MQLLFLINDDELIPPTWINEEFMGKIISNIKECDQTRKISSFTIRPASRKGDHYASIMFRATILCTHETNASSETTMQVIIKTRPPLDTPKGQNLSGTQIFENEWKMYTQVIPLLEAEWERHGEKMKFAGRLLYATLDPQPVIVLEDLCLTGYDILRGRLFNLNEVESCLRKLAKWHAVSYKLTAYSKTTEAVVDPGDTTTTNADASTVVAHAMNMKWMRKRKDVEGAQGENQSITEEQQVPIVSTDVPRTMTNAAKALTQMQQGLFKQKSLLCTDYIGGGVRHIIAALEQLMAHDNDNDNSTFCYVNNSLKISLMKLRLLEPHIMAACTSMNDAFVNGITGPIYVLNHGDFHTANIMIRRRLSSIEKNASGKSEQLDEDDILFIDFQTSFYGTSTFDLQYASFTLFSKDLRDTKRECLFQYYFEHFLKSLKYLKFTQRIPTYEEFKDDCKRWRCFELFLVATFLPLTRLNNSKPHDVDINKIFDSIEYRIIFYNNPDYLNYVSFLLPKYLEAGYLEMFE